MHIDFVILLYAAFILHANCPMRTDSQQSQNSKFACFVLYLIKFLTKILIRPPNGMRKLKNRELNHLRVQVMILVYKILKGKRITWLLKKMNGTDFCALGNKFFYVTHVQCSMCYYRCSSNLLIHISTFKH